MAIIIFCFAIIIFFSCNDYFFNENDVSLGFLSTDGVFAVFGVSELNYNNHYKFFDNFRINQNENEHAKQQTVNSMIIGAFLYFSMKYNGVEILICMLHCTNAE